MTHDNDFPPLFDDTPSDDTDAVRSIYARPQSASESEPDTPLESEDTQPPSSDSVDIDSALAALASLQDLAFQEEAYVDEGYAPPDDSPADSDEGMGFVAPTPTTGEWAAVAVPKTGAPAWSAPLTESSRPSFFTVERGQAASIVPALLLIGGGVWGVLLIATGSVFPAAQLPALMMGSLGVVLLVLWGSLGRRNDGSLFGGLVLLALGLTIGVLTQTDTWAQAYPSLAIALGVACLLSSASIKSYRRWLLLFGIALILGGAGVFAAMSQAVMPQITALVPIVLILAIVLPIVLRLLIPTLPTPPAPASEPPFMVEPDPEPEPIVTETSS